MRTEEIQTPFYLVREDLLEENIRGFKEALEEIWPGSIPAYSVKTNALPWILQRMRQEGVRAETVSDEEYELAKLCGFGDGEIIFNGPSKSPEKAGEALREGATVNLDSRRELDYIRREKPELKGSIGLRINMDPRMFDAGDTGYLEDGFRFGYSEETGGLAEALSVLREVYGEIRIGLHLHVNSATRAPGVYRTLARYAAGLIRKHGIDPAFIDAGGGFFGGVPGKTTPKEYISGIREELEGAVDFARTPLIIEPGSAFIASAVELHTTVTDVKDTCLSRMVTTDGSRLYSDPLWAKKSYLMTTTSRRAPLEKQVICGFTCMDHDRITVLRNEPELAEGDRIVYHRVGNYSVTFGGPFIRPFPAVYAGRDGEARLIRRVMTMDEYYRMEMANI